MVNGRLTADGEGGSMMPSLVKTARARRCFEFYENRAFSNSSKTRTTERTAFSNVLCMVRDGE
jgi:hypothetical protein